MAVTIFRGRRAAGVAGIAVSCALGLILSSAAAHADPAADKTGVQAQIVQTQHDLEVISEQYNDAKIALDQLNAQASAAQAAAAQAASSLGDEQQKVAQTGATLYKGPTLAEAQTIITGSSPQEIIDKLATLDQISKHYGEAVYALQTGQSAAAAAQSDAQQKAAAAAATEQDLAAKKAEIESKLPGLEAQLASLTEAERQAVLAQAGGHATGQPEAAAAPQTTQPSAAASSSSAAPASASAAPQQKPAPSAGTGGSGSAQGAVQAALGKLGSPYVWGAAGPNSFDCSGLTMWAYAQVGVSLPHSSGAQASAGTTVPLSALAPGDIVWMPGHVGMYIGNGQVVHAPTTGDVVKVVSLSSMSWQKGIRVA